MIENRFVLDTNAVIFLTTKGNVIPSDLENDLIRISFLIALLRQRQ